MPNVRVRRDGLASFCCALKFLDDLSEKSLDQYWRSDALGRARLAARAFHRGADFTFGEKQHLRDAQCENCYNYIFNLHSRNELKDLGLLDLLDQQTADRDTP